MRPTFMPNWKLILILVIPVWSIVILIIWGISYPAFNSLINETPFPSSWTWFTVLLADMFFIISGLFAVWGIVSGFLTEITETQIKRNLFFWQEEINLAEVRQMEIRSYRLKLSDEKQKFTISLMFYKKPEEVLNFIKQHIQIQTNTI